MTWTYSGNPADSDLDAARFLIGDTDHDDQLLRDEEILWLLSQQANVTLAAADGCDAISARFTNETDKRVGDVQESAGKRRENWLKRARILRRNASKAAKWFVGGLSKTGKRNLWSNEDAVQPTFRVGQDDHPEVAYGDADESLRNRTP